MLLANNIPIPQPLHIFKGDDSFTFKLPFNPYVIERDGLKYLYRWEEWGVIEYNYKSDQFSALVNPNSDKFIPRAPLSVYWLVTAPCNLRCIHCYGNVEELPRENLSEMQQQYVADQIIKSGAMRVTLNGGEPLLRKDTPQIIEKLADHNISVILGTNGTYMNKAIMKSVQRTSLVEISLDSHDETVNNAIRISRVVSGNSYKDALSAIELCLSHGVKTRVLTCINQRNVNHIEATADLLYSRGVRDWSISWTLYAGRARFIYDELAAWDSSPAESAIDRVIKKYPDLKIKFSNRSNTSVNNRYSCLVFPNGRVFAEDLSKGEKIPFHSLLESPLATSWTEENFNIAKHFERWTSGRVQYFQTKEG